MEVKEIIFHVISMIVASYYVFGQDCGPYDNALSTDSYCMELMFAATPTDESVRYKCKSLLIRTAAKIDYCPSKRCDNGTWTGAQISCGATECYTSGGSKDFEGRRTCTATGYTCQRWDEQVPYAHAYNVSSMFPEGNVTEAENYCRDPNESKGQPWCYTTHPNVTWDYCDVPACADITIDQGKCPGNYCGDIVNPLSTDNMCTYIQPNSYYAHYVGTTVKYTCVSLLAGFVSSISYCPVRTCQEDFYWSNVSISCAENECFDPGNPSQYSGGRSCTKTGKMCQYWGSQSPHPHNYTSLDGFPDPDDLSRGASCRDPGNLRGEPWCYTTDPDVEWELCDVYNCNSMVANNGRCDGTVAPVTITTTEETVDVTTTVEPMTSSATTVVTMAPATVAPPVPKVHNGTVYQRIPDRAGFEAQTTLPYVTSSTDCCRRCSKTMDCVMVTFENGACTLFRLNENNNSTIECSLTQKCYLVRYLV